MLQKQMMPETLPVIGRSPTTSISVFLVVYIVMLARIGGASAPSAKTPPMSKTSTSAHALGVSLMPPTRDAPKFALKVTS